MNRSLTLALLITAAVLSGCASNSPELRPYTAEESHELAMEDLNRRGLSFDEYQIEKARLLSHPQVAHEFDTRGDMNAVHLVARPDRQG
ncbi:MAG: putative lipoprotein [Pseudomonas sp.]|nr:putative lipoprotein [Pseudomonas sp.]